MTTVDRESEGRRYADGYYGEILWDEARELWIVPSRSDPDRVHFVNTDLKCSCWDSHKNGAFCAHARGAARKAVKDFRRAVLGAR